MDLDSTLHAKIDDISTTSCMFERKAVIYHPFCDKDSFPKKAAKWEKIISRVCRLEIENASSNAREYMNPTELLELKDTMKTLFHGACYESVILDNKQECNFQWLDTILCNVFEPNIDRRNCKSCNMIS